MVKKKLDGVVDESSSDQETHKSDVIVHNLIESYDRQAGR